MARGQPFLHHITWATLHVQLTCFRKLQPMPAGAYCRCRGGAARRLAHPAPRSLPLRAGYRQVGIWQPGGCDSCNYHINRCISLHPLHPAPLYAAAHAQQAFDIGFATQLTSLQLRGSFTPDDAFLQLFAALTNLRCLDISGGRERLPGTVHPNLRLCHNCPLLLVSTTCKQRPSCTPCLCAQPTPSSQTTAS